MGHSFILLRRLPLGCRCQPTGAFSRRASCGVGLTAGALARPRRRQPERGLPILLGRLRRAAADATSGLTLKAGRGRPAGDARRRRIVRGRQAPARRAAALPRVRPQPARGRNAFRAWLGRV